MFQLPGIITDWMIRFLILVSLLAFTEGAEKCSFEREGDRAVVSGYLHVHPKGQDGKRHEICCINTTCGAGTEAVICQVAGENHSDTARCRKCKEGHYQPTSVPSYDDLHNKCKAWHSNCTSPGEVIMKPGSKMNTPECRCNNRTHFDTEPSHHKADCKTKFCDAGTEATIQDGRVRCTLCREGTWKEKGSDVPCDQGSRCPHGHVISKIANYTTDTICLDMRTTVEYNIPTTPIPPPEQGSFILPVVIPIVVILVLIILIMVVGFCIYYKRSNHTTKTQQDATEPEKPMLQYSRENSVEKDNMINEKTVDIHKENMKNTPKLETQLSGGSAESMDSGVVMGNGNGDKLHGGGSHIKYNGSCNGYDSHQMSPQAMMPMPYMTENVGYVHQGEPPTQSLTLEQNVIVEEEGQGHDQVQYEVEEEVQSPTSDKANIFYINNLHNYAGGKVNVGDNGRMCAHSSVEGAVAYSGLGAQDGAAGTAGVVLDMSRSTVV